MKSKTSPKENFSLLINLSVKFIKSLPFFPAARDEYFVGNEVCIWEVDEIGLFCCARTVVYVPTL